MPEPVMKGSVLFRVMILVSMKILFSGAFFFSKFGVEIFWSGIQTWTLDVNFSQIWRDENITSKATTVGYVLG
jgi:hypothetical protein